MIEIAVIIPLYSLVIYLLGSLLGYQFWTISLSFVIGTLAIFFLAIKSKLDFKKGLAALKEHFLAVLLIFLILGSVAVILSPLVLPKIENGQVRLRFPGIGDYYKHTYTLTAINQSGLPPAHPYFPEAKFSYYYGYYLIPAAISQLSGLPQNIAFYAYVLVTTAMSIGLIYRLICKFITSLVQRLLALSLIIFGASLDIIPSFLSGGYKFPTYMELWSQKAGLDFIVNNTYTVLLWAPQHFLAGVLTIVVLYYLLLGKPRTVLLVLLYGYIILSSIFVAFTLIIWSALIFVFSPKSRGILIKAGMITAIVLAPFLFQLSDRQNILSFYQIAPLVIFKEFYPPLNWLFNLILTFVFEYGPIFFLLPVLIFVTKFKGIPRIMLIGIYISAILTWFIKSPGFNDFAMRTVLPSQLLIPAASVLVLSQVMNKQIKAIFLSIVLVTLVLSFTGFINEFYGRWKDRTVFTADVSGMLMQLRQMPAQTRIATFEKEEWAFLVPPLGFKNILNPFLHDSGVYLVGKLGKDHDEYETLGDNLFYRQTTGKNLEETISRRNHYFSFFPKYFSKYKFDFLLLNNKQWIKKGVNPWVKVFNEMGINSQPLTRSYTLFNSESVLEKAYLTQPYVDLNDTKEAIVQNRRLTLDKGLWFLVSCDDAKGEGAQLEFEDYYTVLSSQSAGEDAICIGNMFYLPQKEDLLTGLKTTINKVYIYPVKFRKT